MIDDGMVVGLGTGSTANLFIAALAERVVSGLHIIGVSTSDRTEELARQLRIPTATLEDHPLLDVDVDGADEVDPELNVLKGRGGALLHEKIVALSSREFIVIVDESKLVDRLAEHHPIPVEVVAFGCTATRGRLENLGGRTTMRGGDADPYRTDSGNYIVDISPPNGVDVFAFGDAIKATTGVVDHGLFRGVASQVLVGSADGTVRRLQLSARPSSL
jgi:ribose 5-phosphate isomerase A